MSLEQPLPMRKEVAAMLINRDEGGDVIIWARRQIVLGEEATHDGDCTKKCHTCQRCLADRAIADADRLIAFIGDKKGYARAIIAASQCGTTPLPPQIEPTPENKALWSVGHAAGVLNATTAIQALMKTPS